MEKRTFSTAKKPARPASRASASVPSIRPKKNTATRSAKPKSAVISGNRSTKSRASKPVAAAAPPANDNKKILIIGGVVGTIMLIILIAAASGGKEQPRPVRAATPTSTNGLSTHERMMKQRYGGDMDGKTVQEWMKENGDTDWAKQRRDARMNRKR